MKKVLIIAYYWPPAGGPGVQRWLKFVKYLPDFQIQPIVYVPENPTYPIIDEGLMNQVSDKAIIIKRKIIEPYAFASFFSKNKTKKISAGIIPNSKKQSILDRCLLWVRGNIFIPDARVLWVRPSVSYLTNYIKEHQIDTIITTGPPHSLHLIGLELQQTLNLQWIADFRDPWTTIGYHKALKLSAYAEKKHKFLERKVLNSASVILVTSEMTKSAFAALTTKPIEVITNGFDVENVEIKPLDAKFSLAHIGSFLSDRNPQMLWLALSELLKENTNFAADLELKLIGAVSQEVLDTIKNFGLLPYVNNLGYISHKKAIMHQRSAQVLLLIEIDSEETKSIIPGKLFEYMVSERPIIGIGPNGCDFASILKETNTGVFFTYDEKEKLKALLVSHYQNFKNNTLKVNAVGLNQYARKNLTKQLANVIEYYSQNQHS